MRDICLSSNVLSPAACCRVDRQCCRFGRKYTGRCPPKMNPYTVWKSIWPPSALAQNSGMCMCVHFCVNVWCLHLMFAQLINSGDAVLRWHIVQASLSPHPNQISTEYRLCTQRPPGQDFGALRSCQPRLQKKKQEHCKSVGSFVKITSDFCR